MGNHTVNGKKIGKGAGIADNVIINAQSVQKVEKELNATNHTTRKVLDKDYVVVKAYPGGNPNKSKEDKGLTH